MRGNGLLDGRVLMINQQDGGAIGDRESILDLERTPESDHLLIGHDVGSETDSVYAQVKVADGAAHGLLKLGWLQRRLGVNDAHGATEESLGKKLAAVATIKREQIK